MEQEASTPGNGSYVYGGPGPEASDDSRFFASALMQSDFVSFAIETVLELGLPDILAKEGKPLSAQEILAKLPTKSTPGPKSCSNLRRLLRPLVQKGVFSQTLNSEQEDVYGLTEISSWYVKDNERGLVPFAALAHNQQVRAAFGGLPKQILEDEAIPWVSVWGMSVHNYCQKDPQFGAMFSKAMTALTQGDRNHLLNTLQQSGWLDGVKTFVDVGGAEGQFVAQVVARNARIQGINFDLPHVVNRAPPLKGVQHVGGNFFEAVASGDTLFMKYIVHNHDDATVVKILKNCFEALPKNGKVIIAECLMSDSDSSPKAKWMNSLDFLMLSCTGGRERTIAEFRALLAAAGFSNFGVIQSQSGMDLMVAVKE